MSEAHLNGAYYGPSIPPPTTKSYHRPGRGSRGGCCCCCDLFSCLFTCACNCLFKILCTLIVFLGVATVVLWLVLRPHKINFHVEDAALTRFHLSPMNNTLYYDLAVTVSARNPNKRIGVYYDSVDATAFYRDHRLSTVQDLGGFYQGHKNTTVLKAAFKGQSVVPLDGGDRGGYDGETKEGVYGIDVKLKMRIRLKLRWIKTRKMKPTIECDLKVPLSGSKNPFERTRCHLDW
ncbi:hypothetical protein DM860_003398 [Cuscuta australis]|uniref:Late embryogenesis abundant protein LEA-2 subgroup domain-containing protein n=1 Tax=Cuscuta australis TaxID=267555 RepID=A0A328DJZ8_9ASTE|nr:hypothetical protein DM860_003398 [Cuscuta australis]